MRVGELVKLTLPDWREDERTFIVRGKGSRQRLAFLPDDRSLKAIQLYIGQRKVLDVGHEWLLAAASGAAGAEGAKKVAAAKAKARRAAAAVCERPPGNRFRRAGASRVWSPKQPRRLGSSSGSPRT